MSGPAFVTGATGFSGQSLVIRPFDLLEARYRWPGQFGYLMAMVAEKPVRA